MPKLLAELCKPLQGTSSTDEIPENLRELLEEASSSLGRGSDPDWSVKMAASLARFKD